MLFSLLNRCLILILTVCLSIFVADLPAQAAIEPYVSRYLDVAQPVMLEMDGQGKTRSFSATDLSEGKRLFEENCKNCHVGGATLPDPTVSLSLEALHQATPPRDTVNSLVAYLRQPMTYDGSEETFWCRQVAESWMPQTQVENLSAFVLRAAQKAPGWGKAKF
jgi:photosystem II cytochrome c550